MRLHLSLFSLISPLFNSSPFFFFNDTATTEIYTLSLHDALPISPWGTTRRPAHPVPERHPAPRGPRPSARRRSLFRTWKASGRGLSPGGAALHTGRAVSATPARGDRPSATPD